MAKTKSSLRCFARDECGAVTVDWVVLTAALVGLAIAVLGAVSSGSNDIADNIENCLSGDLPHIMDRDGMSHQEKLQMMQRWCSDSIH